MSSDFGQVVLQTLADVITGKDSEKSKNEKSLNGVEIDPNGMDPWLAAYTMGPFCWVNIIAISVVWGFYFKAGTVLPLWSTYWWAWFSAFISIVVPYGFTGIMWFFIFAKDMTTAHEVFYFSSYITYAGPLFMQFFPIAFMLTCVIVGIKSGYWYDQNHGEIFWLPFFSGVIYQTASIVYLLYAVPALKTWFYLKDFNLEEELEKKKLEAVEKRKKQAAERAAADAVQEAAEREAARARSNDFELDW